MPDPPTNEERSGVLDYLRRAVGHAMDALRCYAALLAADAEERVNRSMRSAVGRLTWAAVAVVGVFYFTAGVADLLGAWIGDRVPGGGRMIVGALILSVFLVVVLAERLGQRK